MFDITIEQKTLMKALEYLEPTVGKNANNLGDNCVSMRTTGSGSVEMYTTNTLEFTKLEAIVSNGGNTQEQAPLVDFKRFKSIIGSIPSNEHVSLQANVNDLLINFSLKPTPIQLVGCNNGMLPLPTPTFGSNPMIIPKMLMAEALGCACSIITDNASAPLYNCMRIATDGINVEITGLDYLGKRTFAKTGVATSNNAPMDVLIEASKLKKSMKIYEDFAELELNMNQNIIRIDGADIVSQYQQKTGGMITGISYFARRVNGVYPVNIAQNFAPAPTEFSEINKEELLNSIARAKALEDSTSQNTIRFEVTGNNVIVALNSAYGNIEDSITAENSVTKQIASVFKYEHLSDIMKVINTDTFEIGVLPNHPAYYVIKTKGSNDVQFMIAGVVGQNATP